MPGQLDDSDRRFLQRAIEISRQTLADISKMPFGAVVLVDGRVAGESANRVAELHDPTAHAEVMALRAAGRSLGTHLLPTGVLYSSTEPCPMCLVACYWAGLRRVVFGATSDDAAAVGIEDAEFYRELTLPWELRSLREDPAAGDLRQEAAGVLAAWAETTSDRG
jgi:tRNA(Arg) A34 adenosine deaminase TadA